MQCDHLHMILDHLDKRHKQRPVQAILVQVIRRTVRRGHHRDSGRKQPLKQPTHDHRIGDVGDLHFVKGQKPGGRNNLIRDGGQRIIDAVFAGTRHARMHGLHEFMKMAALFGRGRGLGHHVHQHGFAPAHAPPQINAAHRVGDFAKQPAHHRMVQCVADPVQHRQHGHLRRIGLDKPGGDFSLIEVLNRHRLRHTEQSLPRKEQTIACRHIPGNLLLLHQKNKRERS